ncbi:deoxyribose-phosphate aldolase [Mycobacterium sp.]|uniref:deoxyribose-phosphate aldolase n=1 Tax=Mycobacterium sp. TaxID=1785 RepID=UPI002D0D17C6|nr:deoxyribose-phosphate aldolase [Mycobacterium sp.]HTQ22780.1 deoxyribose-phosphate aldolase [Mycobacterium sp.]
MQSRRPRRVVRVTREQLAALVDHTLLKPEATAADVAALVAEAGELGVYAVCVSPSMVPVAVESAAGGVRVAAVAGFPSGKHLSAIKAQEAAAAVASGASEIDMVIDVGAAVTGNLDAVRTDIAAVRAALEGVAGALLKVIVESAVLLAHANARTLADVCRAAEDAGADYVKTSTGFHPAGGASVRAVALMAETVGGRLGVKASGGIRTADDALAMLDAGATRLGLSGTRAVLDGLS